MPRELPIRPAVRPTSSPPGVNPSAPTASNDVVRSSSLTSCNYVDWPMWSPPSIPILRSVRRSRAPRSRDVQTLGRTVVVATVYTVVGQHRTLPGLLLLHGDDNRYYAHVAGGRLSPVAPTAAWVLDADGG